MWKRKIKTQTESQKSDDAVTIKVETSLVTIPVSVLDLRHAHRGGTRLYDAVDLVITERLDRLQGRKAIVLFTDGVDTVSKLASDPSTIERVEESGVLVYPIHWFFFPSGDKRLTRHALNNRHCLNKLINILSTDFAIFRANSLNSTQECCSVPPRGNRI